MKKKIVSLSLLTLGFCSLAFAADYISPEVGFKKLAAPSKEIKVADLGEHYKVESGVETTRQIASEEAEREPSSVAAKAKKKEAWVPEVQEAPAEAPRPWLYRSETEERRGRSDH